MTRDFEESLDQIVEDVVAKHLDDISAAVVECEERVRKLPGFQQLVDELVRVALRRKITDLRGEQNHRQRLEAGVYGVPAKVVTGTSESVARAATKKSLFDYFIAGTTLGELTGSELPVVGESERKKAAGHTFNSDMCFALAQLRLPIRKSGRPSRKQISGLYSRSMEVPTSQSQREKACKRSLMCCLNQMAGVREGEFV